MSSSSLRLATTVGITNSRLNTSKRGIAVEVAARVAAATEAPVCLIGADPTDRDVERHLPELVAAWGEPARMQVARGPHHVEVANFPRCGLCAVCVSDPETVELVFPALMERFAFLIIDAPSRTGIGVGIADVLLDWLDVLVVATGLNAGELAETGHYVGHLDELVNARHVDVKVLAVGEPDDGGLAPAQLDSRLARLPTIGHVPRLAGRAAHEAATRGDQLDDVFQPFIRWICDGPSRRTAPRVDDAFLAPADARHVAHRHYRETLVSDRDVDVVDGYDERP